MKAIAVFPETRIVRLVEQEAPVNTSSTERGSPRAEGSDPPPVADALVPQHLVQGL
jgi:hypothetical protein